MDERGECSCAPIALVSEGAFWDERLREIALWDRVVREVTRPRVLRNRVSIINTRYTDHMKFYWFFHILWVLLCIIVYMFVRMLCMLLFNFVYYVLLLLVYVFLLLRMFRSRYCDSLCCSVYCLCAGLLPLGVNPIAVIKYII